MRTVPSLLAAVLGCALATAGQARANPTLEAKPGPAALRASLEGWWAWMPTPAAIMAATDQLPIAWLVDLRDVAAAIRDRSEAWLALVPTPTVPDLTVLSASPVPGVESSGFGWRRDPIHRRTKFHKGTDFRADRGTPVFAAGAGVVAFAGVQHGYGKVVYIDHGGGVVTRYAHLSRIETTEGAAIGAATQLGRVGATGRATGPHLHFEIRLDGRAVDPEAAMRVAELQRTDPAAAKLAAWTLSPAAQADATDRHDPPRHRDRDRRRRQGPGRPERRHAPVRDRNRA